MTRPRVRPTTVAFALAFTVAACGSSPIATTTPPVAPTAQAAVPPSPVPLPSPALGTTASPCASLAGSGVVGPIPPGDRVDGPSTLRYADSVWAAGSIAEPNCLVDPLFIWTAVQGRTPVLGELVENASPAVAGQYNRDVFLSPRAVGHLTITAIKGKVVRFRSSSGVTGSFDLDTHAWSFAP